MIPGGRWRELALCRGADANLFYEQHPQTAMAVCAGCPVAIECLAEAIDTPTRDDFGVWGGTGPRERRKLRKRLAVLAGGPTAGDEPHDDEEAA